MLDTDLHRQALIKNIANGAKYFREDFCIRVQTRIIK